MSNDSIKRPTPYDGGGGFKPEISNDPINPNHYQGDYVARICEDFKLTAWEAQVIKYVLRNKNKNGLEDLKKALWYLDREIKRIQKL